MGNMMISISCDITVISQHPSPGYSFRTSWIASEKSSWLWLLSSRQPLVCLVLIQGEMLRVQSFSLKKSKIIKNNQLIQLPTSIRWRASCVGLDFWSCSISLRSFGIWSEYRAQALVLQVSESCMGQEAEEGKVGWTKVVLSLKWARFFSNCTCTSVKKTIKMTWLRVLHQSWHLNIHWHVTWKAMNCCQKRIQGENRCVLGTVVNRKGSGSIGAWQNTSLSPCTSTHTNWIDLS